jgi:hypothetical protein
MPDLTLRPTWVVLTKWLGEVQVVRFRLSLSITSKIFLRQMAATSAASTTMEIHGIFEQAEMRSSIPGIYRQMILQILQLDASASKMLTISSSSLST